MYNNVQLSAKENMYRLTNEWHDLGAEYKYYLEIKKSNNTWEQHVSGNRDWAERIAEHYKIEMPEEN